MPRVTRSALVATDLLEIWLYIAEDNPTAADAVLDKIEAACSTLARSPRAGHARLGPDVRSHPVGRYVIFHRKVPGGIEVIRVLSGYRDISGMI